MRTVSSVSPWLEPDWAPKRTERQESGLSFCLFYPPISALLSYSQIPITPEKFSHSAYTLAQWLVPPHRPAETIRRPNAYNWPRGWGTGARAEEEIRFCFRNEAWAAKVYLVGSANCILRGWGVPAEGTMALQADSAIKHKYLTLQSIQKQVWMHSFSATDMISIKFHSHFLKCLCVTTRNEVNSSEKEAPEHLKSTLPLSKKQMWLLHSWKFSLGSYFVVSYMLWNNTNKAEIICFLPPVVVKYSLFMTTFFPTISLQEHSRRNPVTVTQEHGFETAPVLIQFFVKLGSLLPKNHA